MFLPITTGFPWEMGNGNSHSRDLYTRPHPSTVFGTFCRQVALDTADVAQHVREILSSNNIGQRLFARHVLGLSQGTVSELLSKPKHWDKLTEKGRDSYRRMHQWIRDGGNVAALKAYAPKKGQWHRGIYFGTLRQIWREGRFPSLRMTL